MVQALPLGSGGLVGEIEFEFRLEIGGVIGAANERPGGDVSEAFLKGDDFVAIKRLGSDVIDHGEVFYRRSEVLPKGKHCDSGSAEVVEGGDDFFLRFAETEHNPGLGGDFTLSAGELFGTLEDVERAVVLRARADEWGEPLYGLEVVIEDVGAGVDDGLKRIVTGVEIGNEDLDCD